MNFANLAYVIMHISRGSCVRACMGVLYVCAYIGSLSECLHISRKSAFLLSWVSCCLYALSVFCVLYERPLCSVHLNQGFAKAEVCFHLKTSYSPALSLALFYNYHPSGVIQLNENLNFEITKIKFVCA